MQDKVLRNSYCVLIHVCLSCVDIAVSRCDLSCLELCKCEYILHMLMFKLFICFRELPTTSGVNPVPQPRSTTYSTSSREEKNGYEVAPGFDQVLEEKRYKGRLSSGYPSEDILETRYGGRISPPPRRHYESPSEYQHTDSGYPSTSPVRIKCILQCRALWLSQNCFSVLWCYTIINYFAQHT